MSPWTGKHSSFRNRSQEWYTYYSSKHSATGEPRGFAHADFLDVESAVKAKEKLEEAEVYGRRLRIDFSGNRREGGNGGSAGRPSFNDRGGRGGGRGGYQSRDGGRGGYGGRGPSGPGHRSLDRGTNFAPQE